jgi:hypothetical protein
MNDCKKVEKTCRRMNCLYSLHLAHHLYKAQIKGQCANESTLKEAREISNLINFLFDKKQTTPYDFMKPIDRVINESIDEYEKYKEGVNKWPFNKRLLESFSKWYASSLPDTSMLKCNMIYILEIGKAVIQKETGAYNDLQFNNRKDEVINIGSSIFGYYPRAIMKSFVNAVLKFNEIEQKIEAREEK